MTIHALLALLADGEIHSGQSIASALGVSRTAVWKQIKRVQAEGYEVEKIRGHGYRLVKSIDFLSGPRILAGLPPQISDRILLQIFSETDSTNTEVSRMLVAAEPGQIPVCMANRQSAGRGRHGRVWQSPGDDNIYLSLGCRLAGGYSALDGLSLVVGVSLVEALRALGVPHLALKWPNDLLLNGAKLAGVLIELRGELEGAVQVVVGVGLNVHMQGQQDIDQTWTSLAQACPERRWVRNEIAAGLITALTANIDAFAERGFGAFREAWQSLDVFSGCAVSSSSGELSGIGRGVDDAGNYLIEGSGGIEAVRAGELSLRAAS